MARPLPTEWRKDEVPQELVELRSHLDRLPYHLREKVLPLCDKLGHFARLQGRLVKIAQDAVDQLQLDVKYLLFDLEATRRERDELQAHLEEIEDTGEELD
jgi:hypothetical protein